MAARQGRERQAGSEHTEEDGDNFARFYVPARPESWVRGQRVALGETFDTDVRRGL